MSAASDYYEIGKMPKPYPRCKRCADLVQVHESANEVFNYSAAVDARVRMRWHQHDHSRTR
ncbi:hypothetical protein GCM10010505_57550 [Kitasatospora aburaviensis]